MGEWAVSKDALTYNIETTIELCDPGSSSTFIHGSHHGPFIQVRIVSFTGIQGCSTVITSNSIQVTLKNK